MTVTHYVLISLLVLCILVLYLFIKFNTTFRKDIYTWFVKAEHTCSLGSEKMQYVLDNTYDYLPAPVKIFINRDNYEKILQYLFDCIKDLLDDGKVNKSGK